MAGLLVGLALALGAAGCKASITQKDIERNRIGVGDVSARTRGNAAAETLVVDARSSAEFEAGHIPGARNMRLPDVPEEGRDPALERYKMIIVYGEDPGSATANALAKRLMGAGYKHVRFFGGGMQSWRAAGLPVETGAQ